MAVVFTGWIFFRSQSWTDLVAFFANLGQFESLQYEVFKLTQFPAFSMATAALTLPLLLGGDYVISRHQTWLHRQRQRPFAGAVAGVALFYVILFFGVFGHASFIYFQF